MNGDRSGAVREWALVAGVYAAMVVIAAAWLAVDRTPPEWDHASLTREFSARRISFADPEASPLLRKASGQAPHEGGKLLPQGGRAYNLLVAWIRAGSAAIPAQNWPR